MVCAQAGWRQTVIGFSVRSFLSLFKKFEDNGGSGSQIAVAAMGRVENWRNEVHCELLFREVWCGGEKEINKATTYKESGVQIEL